MKKQLLFLLQLCIIVQLSAQDMPPNAEPGKCYAKCLIQEKQETELLDFFIYTGVETTIKGLDTLYIRYENTDETEKINWLNFRSEITKKSYKKLKYDHQEIIVSDTTKIKSFTQKNIEIDNTIKGGYTEWKEVICGGAVSRKFVKMLNEALVKEGYLDINNQSNIIGTTQKQALTNYQKANDLPVGQLDFETIESLGVKYK